MPVAAHLRIPAELRGHRRAVLPFSDAVSSRGMVWVHPDGVRLCAPPAPVLLRLQCRCRRARGAHLHTIGDGREVCALGGVPRCQGCLPAYPIMRLERVGAVYVSRWGRGCLSTAHRSWAYWRAVTTGHIRVRSHRVTAPLWTRGAPAASCSHTPALKLRVIQGPRGVRSAAEANVTAWR